MTCNLLIVQLTKRHNVLLTVYLIHSMYTLVNGSTVIVLSCHVLYQVIHKYICIIYTFDDYELFIHSIIVC